MTRKTTFVHAWGSRAKAYAERDGADVRVWVWDSVGQHYTTCHSLTLGQRRYVMGRTLPAGRKHRALSEVTGQVGT